MPIVAGMLATMYPRTEAERQARQANAPALRAFTELLHRDPPGPPTDDRWAQSNHCTGVIYTAVCAKEQGLAGATLRIMKRSAQPRFKSKKARRIERELHRRGWVKKAGADTTPEMRDDEFTEAKRSDPFVKLFEHVNENDTLPDLLSDWSMQRDLTGTAFLWCRPSQLGYAAPPAEFYILPTALMSSYVPAAWNDTGAYPYGAWRVMPFNPAGSFGMVAGPFSGAGAVLDGREVKRHRRRHPLFRWDGYSPLTAGGVQFDVLEAIDQSRKAAMDHGFNPDTMVTIKGASEETVNLVAAKLEQRHGGSRNNRRVVVSNGEGVDVESMNTAPREMDYGTGWDQMVKFALALLGVPPAVAGTVEATSYSQLFASLKQFHTLTLGPLAQAVGKFLTKQVIRPYEPDTVVQLDLPQIDDKDQDLKKQDLLSKYGVMDGNELRGWAGLDPRDDCKELIGKGQAEQPEPSTPGGVAPGQDANDALRDKLGLSGAGGGPPKPDNQAGRGSLPGKLAKSRLRDLIHSLG